MPSDPSHQPLTTLHEPTNAENPSQHTQPSSSRSTLDARRAQHQQTLLAKRRQADPDLPKPPPLDVGSGPTSGGPSGAKVASAALAAAPSSPPTAFRRPIPTYPRWADQRDTPRVARTVHDLALFLSSLPLPLHRYTPRLLARTIARLLARQRLMPTNIAFDLALLFWRLIINVFFRSIQPRGAWRIPQEGPIIFIGAPHHNQFLDPLLLASEVRRGSGRRVAFLIAEKSIRRRFIGSAAKILQSIPVTRAADGAKTGKGVVSHHPSGDPLLVQGHGTNFKKQLVPKGQIVLPKWTGYASAEVVEIISDTEVRIKKEWKDERAKGALSGKKAPPSKKAKDASPQPEEDEKEGEGVGSEYQCLPYVDQTEMYASVYEKLAQGGCLGIFPEGGSHDRTDLLPLKAGVVIMALGAMSANPGLKVRLVPVGLSYFHPDKFRSRAVVEFGAPLEVSDELVKLFEAGGEGKRKAVGDMMDLVFDGLKSVTVRAPDYETLMLIQAARRLYTPPGQHLTLPQVVELNRRFIIGYLKFKDDERIQKLKSDVLRYNKMLIYAGLKDHQVERATRAGWRSLGLLFYRLGLLGMWGSMALPGVILNSPIIVLAKIISRIKAREALAASQVKLKGRDVVGTWKVLVSMGVAPILYLTYATAATVLARKMRPDISTKQLALTPLYTMMIIPAMSYSTLKISETALDIIKSLPPLFVSLLPGNQKVINDLQEMRRRLQEEMQALIDELAPQVWENFESMQWRVVGPGSMATPPPSTPSASQEREEGFMWKAKDARARGTASQALSHPLAWADERLFGWRSSRSVRVDGQRRRLSSTERPLSAAEFSGEHPTVEKQEHREAAAALGEVEEEEEQEESEGSSDWDSAASTYEEENDEGDYEAIFSFLNPARLLGASRGGAALSPRSPKPRSRTHSRSRSGSMGFSPTTPLDGGSSREYFGGRRSRTHSRVSSQDVAKMGMTSTNEGGSSSAVPDTATSSASRRRRTHSLTESVHQQELAAASKSASQQRVPFNAAAEALEAQKADHEGRGEVEGESGSKGKAESGDAPGSKPTIEKMQKAARTPGGSQETSDDGSH
ncbi:hypothetical protein BDZ90DRAFT_215501 [Jaminaea rosea]|uniref:Phospholipid/glycerol acyltransferase domain-containing protein n=1 Tax=Jaminaea rosea TaxID=1569628 RepID=A0A316V3G4_9BASI|nr:hypothetical protein BDZ90DRAFT_215501 [Jaminaea rosea]PWN29985.1 hypothetical protein BDZ90DRAFT_215501 [Jaminaea rosea]